MSSPPLQVQHHAYWLPKAGNAEEEYEDAFAAQKGSPPVRAAIADGATEASFSRYWAQQLVAGFLEQEGAAEITEELPSLQEAWEQHVGSLEEGPWYARAKAAEGAHAAFLGVLLEPESRWQAWAVGDCCLFHLRGEDVLLQWPVDSPDAFTNRPALFSSRADHAMPEVSRDEGEFSRGDTFLLATDALAAWLMRNGPVQALGWNRADFTRVVQTARAEGTIRNDDVTLLVLTLTG